MSVFNTKRPNPNGELDKLRKMSNTRKRNRDLLLESMENEATAKAEKTKLDILDKEKDDEDKKTAVVDEIAGRRAKTRRNESIASLESRLIKEGFEALYNQVIFEMAYKALWVDDDVKQSSNIHAMFETFMEIKNNVERILPTNETILVTNLKESVMSIVKEAAHRIANEAKQDCCKDSDEIDKIDFSITKDEDDKLSDLVNLTSDEISELVKEKVLTVVKDEQKAGLEKAEMFKEMDNALKDAKADAAEENNEGDEELPEGEIEKSTDNTAAKESFSIDRMRTLRNRFNRGNRSTLFESIMMFNTKDMKEKAVQEGMEASRENLTSAVFINSLFHYTVLETLNTLKLYDMSTPTNVDKIMNMYK